MNTMIGQTLDGRYRIEALLGKGGMGVVYRATHIHLDTKFAVKILKQELVADQSAIERFRREAKAAGRIHHPNAIQVTDFGVTNESIVYLVMELADGRTLGDLLESEGPLDCRRAVSLMLQISAAVDAAHQGGIIHRDLKPDNIIVQQIGANERIKVLDFGIAKLREREPTSESDPSSDNPDTILRTITEAGTIVGTPQYMSPEQCRARKLDPRSDIYSLGVILYEMLSGRVPYTSDVAIDVMLKQIKEAPCPLRDLVPYLPQGIERAVMCALEKDPARRQPSAARFAAELQQAIAAVEEGDTRAFAPTVIRPSPVQSLSEELSPSDLESSSDERRTVLSPRSDPNMRVRAEPEDAQNLSDLGKGKPEMRSDSAIPLEKSRRSGTIKWPAIVIASLLLGGLIAGVIFLSKPTGTSFSSNRDEMVLIPGGTFKMGRDDGELDERPAHEVSVRGFYLDKYEVTNEKYKKFVDQTQYQPPLHWRSGTYQLGEAKLPVTYVSWYDAAQYAKWAGKRLPTEAEWEYAARNGSKQNLYPWGNNWQSDMAAVGIPNMPKPFAVGSFGKDKNEFGVYDLAGNVSEWVENNFRFYDGSEVYETKVYRGGSFAERDKPPEKITSTYRWYVPADPDLKFKPKIGFRCAMDAK
ncbi:MAG: SUMF1/EgtB/PvdO family nonheme iron enzyme [Acidobacteria bacterium]|nr:SUMF1/EgtB/PvdO family nonheme iron enzyme [Acidobacteriota bacterium]